MLQLLAEVPRFDCTAVRECEVGQLRWDELCEQQNLVLLFESLADLASREEEVARLCEAAERLATLRTRLAVVCRDHELEILQWMESRHDDASRRPLDFPIIADADYHVSSLYEMLSADGPLWGQVIADANTRVRSIAEYSFPVELNVDELVLAVATIIEEETA